MGESPATHGMLLGASPAVGGARNIRHAYGQPATGSLFSGGLRYFRGGDSDWRTGGKGCWGTTAQRQAALSRMRRLPQAQTSRMMPKQGTCPGFLPCRGANPAPAPISGEGVDTNEASATMPGLL